MPPCTTGRSAGNHRYPGWWRWGWPHPVTCAAPAISIGPHCGGPPRSGTSWDRWRCCRGGARRRAPRAAADAGFASPSHFSDTFRAMFGLTPTAFTRIGGDLHIIEQ
ncbi:helix-turn-helix domain-containing protein [Nocardia carnea]|uniref:helix-turn-helix domain-containing protein n=1 Tax=Nocardia carnea TaxID=37328 RepID=UPI0032AFD3F6